MSKRSNAKTVNKRSTLYVDPYMDAYNRYNMSVPRSFSVYNDEGSVIYRGDVEKAANQLRSEVFGVGRFLDAPVVKQGKYYDKKRPFFLCVALILSALLIAAAVVGILVDKIAEYISIATVVETKVNVTMLDPVLCFVKSLANDLSFGKINLVFSGIYSLPENAKFAETFAYYAMNVAIALYAIFALIMFFVSIAGLARKKDSNGFYHKAKLGFISIVMLLCSLITAVCFVVLVGGKVDVIVDFIARKGAIGAGYLLYAMIGVPVLTFICSCCAFRRYKG